MPEEALTRNVLVLAYVFSACGLGGGVALLWWVVRDTLIHRHAEPFTQPLVRVARAYVVPVVRRIRVVTGTYLHRP